MARIATVAEQHADSPQRPFVTLRGIGKSFDGIPILRDISLDIMPGSVHGLVGENGAGKSSLSKIIAGVYHADAGSVEVRGESVTFHSPREARAHGIATIAQELTIVPTLTVAENVFLGAEPRRSGFVSRKELRQRYEVLAAESGFTLPADAPAGSLRTADQQKIEIMRAIAAGASFIIMDEPTAALSGPDVERLHEIVRSLAAQGRTVVLVSHFLREILDLADTITILRDGRLVRTAPASEETEMTLIQGMLGRTLGSVYPPHTAPAADARTILRVDSLSAPGVNGVSFELHEGEILGLAGLVGAGRSEIAHAVFGSNPLAAGTVTVGDEQPGQPTVRRSLRSGVFLIPESRKDQGLILQRPIRENVTLPNLAGLSTASWVRRKLERSEVVGLLSRVTVAGDDRRRAVALSGGNQQKVLFGRALQRRRRVLIADEPTRGVDVGSRRGIYDLLVDQAASGIGVLLISSDVEEILGLAHRVLVIRGGCVVAELTGAEMTESRVLAAAFGQPHSDGDMHPSTPASAEVSP
jgi:simple sugar transport system ATP-binding protein/ribose transport system ATP-binding protein